MKLARPCFSMIRSSCVFQVVVRLSREPPTTPEHGEKNLPWGVGETPINEILQMVKKNKWTMPATIELEYQVPEGSDAVKEVAKCLEYCRAALA